MYFFNSSNFSHLLFLHIYTAEKMAELQATRNVLLFSIISLWCLVYAVLKIKIESKLFLCQMLDNQTPDFGCPANYGFWLNFHDSLKCINSNTITSQCFTQMYMGRIVHFLEIPRRGESSKAVHFDVNKSSLWARLEKLICILKNPLIYIFMIQGSH